MRLFARVAAAVVAALTLAVPAFVPIASGARADEPPGAIPSTRIAWSADLPAALAKAKETSRVLMVCINAKSVDGRAEEESAAKGLREIVYRNPKVVEKSRSFVCVLLTAEGTSAEYDALRKIGISGLIVSPQHVFVNSAGDKILHRAEYWRHGSGEEAVEAMLAMMARALEEASRRAAADSDPAPEGEGRAAWIAKMLGRIPGGGAERDRALERLVRADKGGDCTGPLLALLPDYEKDASTLRALVRILGRDGLEAAAVPLSERLTHRETTVRANAAVSLEYVGSRDKRVVAALTKCVEREKDEGVANHAFRALGRCGAEDARVRALLLRQAEGGKSEFASLGPAIGLAYFPGDEKAMRGVESILSALGVPGGRRGGGTNSIKRGVVSWTLAAIGDAKSAAFVRKDLIDGLKNVKAFWVEGLRSFWESVAKTCDGDKASLSSVESGVRTIAQFARGAEAGQGGEPPPRLMDEARQKRDPDGFRPLGDDLLGDGE